MFICVGSHNNTYTYYYKLYIIISIHLTNIWRYYPSDWSFVHRIISDNIKNNDFRSESGKIKNEKTKYIFKS